MISRRHFLNFTGAALLAAALIAVFAPGSGVQAKAAEEVYDLVLFFGQSNMVGSAMGYTTNPFTDIDPAIASEITGIDEDLIENTVSAAKVVVDIPDGAALKYSLLSDSLVPVTGDTCFGEWEQDANSTCIGVRFNPATNAFEPVYLGDAGLFTDIASTSSVSTNLIHEFCAEWYQETGHGVIVLFAAAGGVPLEKFLPVDDPDYLVGYCGAYIFEYIRASVIGAMQKAAAEGIPLQNAFFVSFQGEGNARDSKYRRVYQKIISDLRELGFTKGALVETSNTIGDPELVSGVKRVHRDQEAIIAEDPDLCLGSSLDYDHYIPDRAAYEGSDSVWRDQWGDLPYDEAYKRARLFTDTLDSNIVHLNSTALCMIGRQSADSLASLAGLN